jgi:hypothetical protein
MLLSYTVLRATRLTRAVVLYLSWLCYCLTRFLGLLGLLALLSHTKLTVIRVTMLITVFFLTRGLICLLALQRL